MSDIDISAIANIVDLDERQNAAIKLIETIELAPPPPADFEAGETVQGGVAESGGPSAGIAAAAAASFAADVSDSDKEAVNLCMLFAQRAVLAKFPGGIASQDALNMYRNIVSMLGWPMPVMSFRHVDSSELQGRCDRVVLGLMRGFMNADAIKLFSLVLGGVEKDPKADNIFSRNAKNENGGNFSTGAVTMDSGLVKMIFGMYSIQTSVTISRILWFEFRHTNAKVDIAYAEGRLIKSVWGPLRDTVLKRLGKDAENIINDIPLANPTS